MFLNNELYSQDIDCISQMNLPWNKLHNRSILITGATGLLGTFLIDLLMYKNENDNLSLTIYAIGRSKDKAKDRLGNYFDKKHFKFIEQDINEKIETDDSMDFIIHAASNTHPVAYSTDPIGTITTNIIGTMNVLNFAVKKKSQRVAFLSTVEIYGENKGDIEKFNEDYLGYINCNTLRAGYPESKRAGEAMCQAYIAKYNLDIVIPRLCRVYGPTMQESDSKALAQFIRNAVNCENIILKSEGNQQYSYIYMADAISAILKIILDGKKSEAYNISDESSDVSLKHIAEILAKSSGREVVFELPNELEKRGYSTATKAMLNSDKLNELGWSAKYDIKQGLNQTVNILQSKNGADLSR